MQRSAYTAKSLYMEPAQHHYTAITAPIIGPAVERSAYLCGHQPRRHALGRSDPGPEALRRPGASHCQRSDPGHAPEHRQSHPLPRKNRAQASLDLPHDFTFDHSRTLTCEKRHAQFRINELEGKPRHPQTRYDTASTGAQLGLAVGLGVDETPRRGIAEAPPVLDQGSAHHRLQYGHGEWRNLSAASPRHRAGDGTARRSPHLARKKSAVMSLSIKQGGTSQRISPDSV